MLEKLRKQGASAIIYVLFGILIAGFVINFGPQSRGSDSGCTGASPDMVIDVDGVEQGRPAWQFVYNLLPGGQRRQKSETTMEILLRREILAQEAERRGLRVSDELVDRAIKEGVVYFAGNRIDVDMACEKGMAPQFCYFTPAGGKWFFDFERWKSFLAQMGMSIPNFKQQQKREILAQSMIDILGNGAPASRDEALSRYLHENTTVTFDAVQFDPRSYVDALQISSADVERFLASHLAEVKKKFDDEAASYKGVPAQVHLRQVYVKRGEVPGGGADQLEPPVGQIATPPPTDTGKTEIEKLRADIVAGKKTFADAAKASNETDAQRALAGDLGWHAVDAPGLSEPALNDAVKTLKPGEVSPVISVPKGYFLLVAEGEQRKGDLTFEQVKLEVALDLARTTWAKEAAKRDALAALAKAREGTGQNLDALFPRGAPKLTPEEMQQLFNKSGSTQSWESEDVPASWQADGTAQPAAGGAPAAPAAAPGAAPAAPAAPAPVVASSDVLPAMGEVIKPATTKFGPVTRDREEIASLGKSAELMRALFDQLTVGEIAAKVYDVDGTFVLVQLTEKKVAKAEDFAKDAEKNVASMSRERGNRLLSQWVSNRCRALAKDGKISFAKDRVTEHDDKGNALPITYQPCSLIGAE